MEVAVESSQTFAQYKYAYSASIVNFWCLWNIDYVLFSVSPMSLEKALTMSVLCTFTFAMVLTWLKFRTFLNLLPSSEADTETFTVDQPLEVGPALGIHSSVQLISFATVFSYWCLVCPIRGDSRQWHSQQWKCQDRWLRSLWARLQWTFPVDRCEEHATKTVFSVPVSIFCGYWTFIELMLRQPRLANASLSLLSEWNVQPSEKVWS